MIDPNLRDPRFTEVGLQVLRGYYAAWKYFPAAKGISFEQLVTILKSRRPLGGENFVPGIGNAILEANISASRYNSAMEKLANAGKGKLPASNGDFFNALNGVAISTNFVDAASFVITESAKDVLKGAESVGQSLLVTGKIVNFMLPAILVGALFWWLNEKSDGAVVKTFNAVKGLR